MSSQDLHLSAAYKLSGIDPQKFPKLGDTSIVLNVQRLSWDTKSPGNHPSQLEEFGEGEISITLDDLVRSISKALARAHGDESYHSDDYHLPLIGAYDVVRRRLSSLRSAASAKELTPRITEEIIPEVWYSRIRNSGSLVRYQKKDLRSDVRDFVVEALTRSHIITGGGCASTVDDLMALRQCMTNDDLLDLANFARKSRRIYKNRGTGASSSDVVEGPPNGDILSSAIIDIEILRQGGASYVEGSRGGYMIL